MQHGEIVTSAQFSPDGRRIVTTSFGNTARLWDALSGKSIGDPTRQGDTDIFAQFSSDGQRVVTASEDQTARLWDFPTINNSDSAEDVLMLADLAEATGGIVLQTSGQEKIQNALTSQQIQASRENIAARFSRPFFELTPLQRLLKWSASDPRNRTISPLSELRIAEWVENRIQEGTLDALRAAIQVDTENARLIALFGLALANLAAAEETNPDVARRAVAEADYQTRRAMKLDPDNDEVRKLRDEVAKAQNIDLKNHPSTVD
jgi:WD domain, G-beta repeat